MSKKPATETREGDPSGEWVMGLDNLGTPRELAIADDRRSLGADPYNKDTPEQKQKRRSLDDMRRLSRAIKSAPTWTPPDKTQGLFQRLALLRVGLESALVELKAIHKEARGCADREAERALIEQLRSASEHIETALDDLMSLEK